MIREQRLWFLVLTRLICSIRWFNVDKPISTLKVAKTTSEHVLAAVLSLLGAQNGLSETDRRKLAASKFWSFFTITAWRTWLVVIELAILKNVKPFKWSFKLGRKWKLALTSKLERPCFYWLEQVQLNQMGTRKSVLKSRLDSIHRGTSSRAHAAK